MQVDTLPTKSTILHSDSLGRLVLTNVLGRGGMGLVWSATCPDSERVFAVKMLATPLASASDARARFDNEAAILGSLDAIGMVHLHGRGETDKGVPFLVMDRARGRSLDKILLRKKALTVRQTASLLAPLLRTLTDVHRHGVSHRDIKPANIMMHRSAGELTVTLIDFGVAGAHSDAPRADGRVAGTLHYMSPEQAFATDRPSPYDDLWSIAVVAYECLTGQMPFDAKTVGQLFAALDHGTFAPVSRFRGELLPEVDAFFQKALSRHAGDRFPTCKAMLDALESLPQTDLLAPREDRSRSPLRGTSRTQVERSRLPRWQSPLPALDKLPEE